MKVHIRKHKTPIQASYMQGLVSVWWYTNSGEFWGISCTLDEAVESYGYLQVSLTENHMNMWRKVVYANVSADRAEAIIAKGYKSIERGRVVFNIRTHAYEIICSEALLHDEAFRDACIAQFGLSGNRYSFEALPHYGKQELTGNPSLDQLYYEDGMF